MIIFTSAFFALIVLAFTYAILSGRPADVVAAHEQQVNGVAFGLASLLMLVGLREVLRLYGGNRRMLEPANALIARVTGIFGPVILVGFGFSNALDLEYFRAAASGGASSCLGGVPTGVAVNAVICALAVAVIVLVPLVVRGRRFGIAAPAMIGHITLGLSVVVAVWISAVVPFLPVEVVGGPVVERLVLAVGSVSAAAFGAAAWLSRSGRSRPREPRGTR